MRQHHTSDRGGSPRHHDEAVPVTDSSGAHRAEPTGRGGSGRRTRVVLVAVSLLVAGGAVAAGAVRLGDDEATAGTAGCAREERLRVVTAPEIAPVVATLAGRMEDRRPCVSIEVEPAAPVDVVAGLTAGDVDAPDVWVPDSSLWLTRAELDALAEVEDAPSVATSPLVIAMSGRTARAVAGGAHPTMDDLVATAARGQRLTVALSDEPLSPARVGTVLALAAATEARPDARGALTALLRAARPIQDEAAARAASQPRTTVALPEQVVWAANRAEGLGLVAVYPGAVAFDYPYAVLAASSGRRELAADLLASLTTPAGQRTVMTAGFRDAQGAPSPVVGTDAGADGAQVVATSPVSGKALDLAERTLAVVNQDASLLAVMDVSGSMAWPMTGPDGSGPSRIRIATRAAAEGMSLYPDSTAVGLWLFPKPGDDRAHQEVAPVAALAKGDRRRLLARTLGSIRAIPGGNTPLYAATAAAVRAQQRGWQPDKINAVIVLSDGANTVERPGGLSGLLDELRASKASRRPVPVITVAFGPEADAASLARISRASGGVAYRASEGRGVREIFLDALGQRVCRPDCS